MTKAQERIERAGKLSVIANKEFLSENRELLVSFDRAAVQQAMLATIRLNFAEAIRGAEPDISFYLQVQEKAFLGLLDRGAVVPVAPITPLGQQAIDAMRKRTGIGAETLPAPVPELTPAQTLEVEVRNDWKVLSSKQIKAKMQGNRLYRECLDRLAPELDSAITSHVTIPGT